MKRILITMMIYLCLPNLANANENNAMKNEKMPGPANLNVVEIVIFRVSDPEEGMNAARALIVDAKAFNNAILDVELYQSASDPNTIAQKITWSSMKEAKEAFAASTEFPSMKKTMELMTENLVFDHFYQQPN